MQEHLFQHDSDPNKLPVHYNLDRNTQGSSASMAGAEWDHPDGKPFRKPGELLLQILTELTES